MTDINKLIGLLEKIAGASAEITRLRSGIVQIDVVASNRGFYVEYRPEVGFGLTSLGQPEGDSLFGSGTHEFYVTPAEIVNRIAELVRTGEHTKLMRAALLHEVRAALGISQTELAERLQMKQPSLSKIEKQGRLQLDTLERYIRALGGKLKVIADVDGHEYELRFPRDDFESERPSA